MPRNPLKKASRMSGYVCARRFEGLTRALAALPARSCVIEGEVTAFGPSSF
jgi:hypothetical protein